jgi:predicted amidohydrolase YtcJ
MIVKAHIPLLKDHHNHPFLYAALGNCLDLRSIRCEGDAFASIRSRDEDLVVAIGWNDSLYTFDRHEFDQLPPVLIVNTSLHKYLVNKAAADMLAASHADMLVHIKDSEWIEKNFPKVLHFIMGLKPCRRENAAEFFDLLLRQGVWHADEMSLQSAREIDLFTGSQLMQRTRFWADMDTFAGLSTEYRRSVHGIKFYADGALGAKTAKLQKPYLTGETGILVYTDEDLFGQLLQVTQIKKAVAVHAIGDATIDQVIRVIEAVKKESAFFPETRMEHCQFISRPAAEKAKSLGIILSMQPNFSIESDLYQDRLSDEYWLGNNPFRMLIDEVGFQPGNDLVFGSDGMPHGAEAALHASLFPPLAGQTLTLDEFVAGYCLPDEQQGYIDVCIDKADKTISLEVVPADVVQAKTW